MGRSFRYVPLLRTAKKSMTDVLFCSSCVAIGYRHFLRDYLSHLAPLDWNQLEYLRVDLSGARLLLYYRPKAEQTTLKPSLHVWKV